MKTYNVKTQSNKENAFFGQMFRDSIIEFISDDGKTQVYEIQTEHDLDRIFDMNPAVIEYTEEK